jgi:hypothetical protein
MDLVFVVRIDACIAIICYGVGGSSNGSIGGSIAIATKFVLVKLF